MPIEAAHVSARHTGLEREGPKPAFPQLSTTQKLPRIEQVVRSEGLFHAVPSSVFVRAGRLPIRMKREEAAAPHPNPPSSGTGETVELARREGGNGDGIGGAAGGIGPSAGEGRRFLEDPVGSCWDTLTHHLILSSPLTVEGPLCAWSAGGRVVLAAGKWRPRGL